MSCLCGMLVGFGIVWNICLWKGENFCVLKNVSKLRNRSDMLKGIWLDCDFRGFYELIFFKWWIGI